MLFTSRICLHLYTIVIFFLQAEKKGASNTVVGLIFGCFALVNFWTSLILGNYVSIIEAVTYFCDDTGSYMKTVL